MEVRVVDHPVGRLNRGGGCAQTTVQIRKELRKDEA